MCPGTVYYVGGTPDPEVELRDMPELLDFIVPDEGVPVIIAGSKLLEPSGSAEENEAALVDDNDDDDNDAMSVEVLVTMS